MYEMHEEMTQLFGTVKGFYDNDKDVDAENLLDEEDNRELLDLTFDKKKRQIQSKNKKDMDEWTRMGSEFKKEIDAIHRDPLMLPETKQKEINKIIKARNEMDKDAFEYFSPLFGRK